MNSYKDINTYIKTFPNDIQIILKKMREVIKKAAPKATETISYGIPTFDFNGHHLVHFAAYKTHIGFYPTSSGVAAFKKEILKYDFSKGTIQFPINGPIPFTLITKIVKFRVKENKVLK
ncbi:MAG: hypothetical protein JWP09_374 [Candidatus Taylorbacteria bacterium]|nr:hypothetical protein [Candidatus Taylorbacteria bacterium]